MGKKGSGITEAVIVLVVLIVGTVIFRDELVKAVQYVLFSIMAAGRAGG